MEAQPEAAPPRRRRAPAEPRRESRTHSSAWQRPVAPRERAEPRQRRSEQGRRQRPVIETGDPSEHCQSTASPRCPESNQTRNALLLGMPSQNSELHHEPCSPERIRATWSGTASVEDATQAFGMSRSKGYDLALREEFPCRVLPIGRATRVVTASLLRVLESGEPEYNGTPITRTDLILISRTTKPRRSRPAGLRRVTANHTGIADSMDTLPPDGPLLDTHVHIGPAGRPWTASTTCARWDRPVRALGHCLRGPRAGFSAQDSVDGATLWPEVRAVPQGPTATCRPATDPGQTRSGPFPGQQLPWTLCVQADDTLPPYHQQTENPLKFPSHRPRPMQPADRLTSDAGHLTSHQNERQDASESVISASRYRP